MFIIIILVVLIVLYIVFTQRKLVKVTENIENAFYQIKVNQQSRFDALTQLAKATASYSEYESKTLSAIIDKRKNVSNVSDVEANEESIRSAISHINVVAEQYPDLKSSVLYKDTMSSIKDYEEKVRISRMVFNDSVTISNRLVKQMPSSLVANMLGFTTASYLETNPEKDEMPDLKF